jgi:hypothetical protein
MQVLGGPEQQNKSLTRLVWSSRSFSEREAGFLFLKTFPSRENAIPGLAKKMRRPNGPAVQAPKEGFDFAKGVISAISRTKIQFNTHPEIRMPAFSLGR